MCRTRRELLQHIARQFKKISVLFYVTLNASDSNKNWIFSFLMLKSQMQYDWLSHFAVDNNSNNKHTPNFMSSQSRPNQKLPGKIEIKAIKSEASTGGDWKRRTEMLIKNFIFYEMYLCETLRELLLSFFRCQPPPLPTLSRFCSQQHCLNSCKCLICSLFSLSLFRFCLPRYCFPFCVCVLAFVCVFIILRSFFK